MSMAQNTQNITANQSDAYNTLTAKNGREPDVAGLWQLTFNDTCNERLRISQVTLGDLQPPECKRNAEIVYGTVIPALAVFVTIANIIIVKVFMKPRIRSHTTFVLTMIAVVDTLALFIASVFDVYHYSTGNFNKAVPYRFCLVSSCLIVLKDMLNMVSIWLTIVLAYIRYRCIHSPFTSRMLHSKRNIALWTLAIVAMAIMTEVPNLFAFETQPIPYTHLATNETYEACVFISRDVFGLGNFCTYRRILQWIEILFSSIVPCLILVVLDVILLTILRKASISRKALRNDTLTKRCNSKQGDDNCIKHDIVQTGRHIVNTDDALYKDRDNGGNIAQDSEEVHDTVKDSNKVSENATEKCKGVHETVEDNNEVCESTIENGREESGAVFTHQLEHLLRHANDATIARYEFSIDKPCTNKRVDTEEIRKDDRQYSFLRKIRQKLLSTSASEYSNDSVHDKLDRECQRTSWLIIVVVTIIIAHEIPISVMYVHALVTSQGQFPITPFGCKHIIFNLWGHVTYPLVFFIYCGMSSQFRKEFWTVLTCHREKSHTTERIRATPRQRNAFMSPCSVRKNLSRVGIHNDQNVVIDFRQGSI